MKAGKDENQYLPVDLGPRPISIKARSPQNKITVIYFINILSPYYYTMPKPLGLKLGMVQTYKTIILIYFCTHIFQTTYTFLII